MTPSHAFGWLVGLLFTLPVGAAQPSLPEPLTLAAALATADNPAHHALARIEQRLEAVRAELGVERASSGFSLDLRGQLREVGPSDAAIDPDETNDSAASLVLSKPLYDFGRQHSREQALALRLEALEWQKQLLIEQRRLEILERYSAVLDADNDFIADDRSMLARALLPLERYDPNLLGRAARVRYRDRSFTGRVVELLPRATSGENNHPAVAVGVKFATSGELPANLLVKVEIDDN